MIRRNERLHAVLERQIADHRAATGRNPSTLALTHDEIDEWRNQFKSPAPSVESLAYRHIPIREIPTNGDAS